MVRESAAWGAGRALGCGRSCGATWRGRGLIRMLGIDIGIGRSSALFSGSTVASRLWPGAESEAWPTFIKKYNVQRQVVTKKL